MTHDQSLAGGGVVLVLLGGYGLRLLQPVQVVQDVLRRARRVGTLLLLDGVGEELELLLNADRVVEVADRLRANDS